MDPDALDIPDDWQQAALVAGVLTTLVVGTISAAVYAVATSPWWACRIARRIARQHAL